MSTDVIYADNFQTSLYLAHHGTEGMKWGVRNGPPYPLIRGGNGLISKIQKKRKENSTQSYEEAYGDDKKDTSYDPIKEQERRKKLARRLAIAAGVGAATAAAVVIAKKHKSRVQNGHFEIKDKDGNVTRMTMNQILSNWNKLNDDDIQKLVNSKQLREQLLSSLQKESPSSKLVGDIVRKLGSVAATGATAYVLKRIMQGPEHKEIKDPETGEIIDSYDKWVDWQKDRKNLAEWMFPNPNAKKK